jgi:hypothetical protein
MNYNFVQREVKTLGEDLTELGETIIVESKDPSPQAPHAITPVPAVLATLTCVQQKLSALLSYIRESL